MSTEFEEKVEKEAEKISAVITNEEVKKRRDMRGDLTFTIDPFDAKDFDDAISFKKIEENKYEVGVHIADPQTDISCGRPWKNSRPRWRGQPPIDRSTRPLRPRSQVFWPLTLKEPTRRMRIPRV